MQKLQRLGFQAFARAHVRFYRKRRTVNGSHIPSLNTGNDFLKNQKIVNLDARSPNEFEKALKNIGFEEFDARESSEDLLLKYLKLTNPGFKKTSKHLRNLQNELSNTNLDDSERLKVLFDYILVESELEIRRLQTMNLDALKHHYNSPERRNALQEPIESEEELEQGLLQGLFRSPGDNEEIYLTNTDLIYHILTDLNNKKESKILSVEQLVQAFELAKLIPIEGRRKRGIFLAGNIIYSLGNIRMDPVNESFYIDSLVNYGLFKKAFNLFETNKTKVEQRWWYEMGMMIALRANYLRKFDLLLDFTDSKFNEYPYISPKVLKLAIKKKLFLRDFKSANALTERFLELTRIHGCTHLDHSKNDSRSMITFQSESRAVEFLNEKELASDQDFIDVIEYHVFKKNFETAFHMMARYIETPGITQRNYKFLIVQMKLNLLRDFNYLKQTLEPHMSPKYAQQHLTELEVSFNQIVKEFNVDSSECQELLFESVNALAGNSSLRNTIEEFVVKKTAGTEVVDNKNSLSRRFQCLLKILLASGKEHEASKIISKMEEAHPNSGNVSDIFVAANAHHYAVFIDYYTVLLMKASKKKQTFYEEKVSNILQKMRDLKVSTNAVLLTKALIFYRETNNFDECFKLINEVLRSKDENDSIAEANRTNLYGRRDITRPLYVEIWKAYSKYYKIFTKELERIDKKSNYHGWKVNAANIIKGTKIHPEYSIRTVFSKMIQCDNVLPDVRMYYIILLTFMRRRDWSAIPTLLTTMSKIHGLEIPRSFVQYFMKGLEREFILLYSKLQEGQGTTPVEAKTNSLKTICEYKKSGKIIVPTACQQDTSRMMIEQMHTIFKSIDSETYTTESIDNAMREMTLSDKVFHILTE